MKQTLTALALSVATTQATVNDNFALIDASSVAVTNLAFLNKGGETLIAGNNGGTLSFYYQSLLGASKAQTIYKFGSYSIATPVSGATFPTAVALVSFLVSFFSLQLFSSHPFLSSFSFFFPSFFLSFLQYHNNTINYRHHMKPQQTMPLPQQQLQILTVKFIFMKVNTVIGLINKF